MFLTFKFEPTDKKDQSIIEAYLNLSWSKMSVFKNLAIYPRNFYLKKNVVAYDLETTIPNPMWAVLILGVTNYLFTNWKWMYGIATLFFLLSFFWSKYYLYFQIKSSLKKIGFKGKTKMISQLDLIREMIQVQNGSD